VVDLLLQRIGADQHEVAVQRTDRVGKGLVMGCRLVWDNIGVSSVSCRAVVALGECRPTATG
jgi:hypothetical protein